MLIAYIIFY